MKKYRLKHWYPGLPEKWKEEKIVVYKTDMKDYVQHKQVGQKYICPYFFVPELAVENNPDFWEELPGDEPNYAIAVLENKLIKINNDIVQWCDSVHASGIITGLQQKKYQLINAINKLK